VNVSLQAIYDLLTDYRMTDIAASVVGPEVAAHGDYWIRPSTKAVAASGVPFHQVLPCARNRGTFHSYPKAAMVC
jgi:hypothetical protein